MDGRINLLPWREMQEAALRQRFIRQLIVTGLMALGVLLVWHYLETARLHVRQQRLARLHGVHEGYDRRLHELDRLQTHHAALQARTDRFARLQAERSLAVRILDQLARGRPQGIRYTRLQLTGETLSVQGETNHHESIGALIRALEASGILYDPVLSTIHEQRDVMGSAFRLTLKVYGSPGEDKEALRETPEPVSTAG